MTDRTERWPLVRDRYGSCPNEFCSGKGGALEVINIVAWVDRGLHSKPLLAAIDRLEVLLAEHEERCIERRWPAGQEGLLDTVEVLAACREGARRVRTTFIDVLQRRAFGKAWPSGRLDESVDPWETIRERPEFADLDDTEIVKALEHTLNQVSHCRGLLEEQLSYNDYVRRYVASLPSPAEWREQRAGDASLSSADTRGVVPVATSPSEPTVEDVWSIDDVIDLEKEHAEWLFEDNDPSRPSEAGFAARKFVEKAIALGVTNPVARWEYAQLAVEHMLQKRILEVRAEEIRLKPDYGSSRYTPATATDSDVKLQPAVGNASGDGKEGLFGALLSRLIALV